MSWQELAADLSAPSSHQLVGLTPAEQVVVTYLRQGLSLQLRWIGHGVLYDRSSDSS